jgi:hypothetical protein
MKRSTVALGCPYRNLAQMAKKWPSPLGLLAHEQRKIGKVFPFLR